jgi:hypothetical protein
MNSAYWKGLAVGLALSFAASVAANLFHNKIIRALDRGRIVSHQRLKTRADRFYKLVSQLHSGKRDKYFYIGHIILGALVALIGSSTSIILCVIVAPKPSPIDLLPWSPETFPVYATAFLAYFFLLLFVLLLRRFYRVRRALEDFDAFEAEHHKRWGGPPT